MLQFWFIFNILFFSVPIATKALGGVYGKVICFHVPLCLAGMLLFSSFLYGRVAWPMLAPVSHNPPKVSRLFHEVSRRLIIDMCCDVHGGKTEEKEKRRRPPDCMQGAAKRSAALHERSLQGRPVRSEEATRDFAQPLRSRIARPCKVSRSSSEECFL